MPALAQHAGDLLLAARDEFLAVARPPPVFEYHKDPVLHRVPEPHTYQNLVECRDLSQVLARTAGGYQAQSMLKLGQDGRGLIAEKHFSATALPSQVVCIIDIADQIGLFKSNYVAVLICPHFCSFTRMDNTSRSSAPRTAVANVAISRGPDESSTHPSIEEENTSAAFTIAPAFFIHSMAVQTRVAEAFHSSPVSLAMTSPSAKRSGPNRSYQAEEGRLTTASISQPSGPSPATASVRPCA